MTKKLCKICGTEFELQSRPGGNNQVVCSPKCKKENDSKLKRESFLRLKDDKVRLIKYYSNLWKIPIYQINKYGIEFLNNHQEVLEVIRLQTKLSGKFTFLTDEEKEVRRKATIRDHNKAIRDKRGYKRKPCKICGTEFSPGIDTKSCGSLCCSEKCSKELHRIQASEAGARRRLKLKQLKTIKNEH